jgi:hypothetical protein
MQYFQEENADDEGDSEDEYGEEEKYMGRSESKGQPRR